VTDPVLYIIMRGDMDSLNPGKAAAQACHAANAWMFRALYCIPQPQIKPIIEEWLGPYGFGTTIVLQPKNFDDQDIKKMINDARANLELTVGYVTDESYPIRDGACTHHIPVITCGYIFGPRDIASPLVADLPLMR
jgi:peptidyl-tRNA hydrolase